MDITIHAAFLPHEGPETAPARCRDTLGSGTRNGVGHGTMRWITAGPAGRPGTSVQQLR
nr:hypothetical protein [Streptomyces sp. YIM 98790]